MIVGLGDRFTNLLSLYSIGNCGNRILSPMSALLERV
jgi:hypothetical protein